MIIGIEGLFYAGIFSLILLLFFLFKFSSIFYERPIEKKMNHMLRAERSFCL
jgi:hypothetical protein